MDETIHDTIEKCQRNRQEEVEDNEEKMEESRKPKLSLSLTKKSNSNSSQSPLPSSSLDVKSKHPVLDIDPSMSTEEKQLLDNTQVVPHQATVDRIKDLTEESTKELVVASKEDIADRKESQDLDIINQDVISESSKALVVDSKADVTMGTNEGNIKYHREDVAMATKEENVVMNCNGTDDKENNTGIQNVKVILQKSTKKRSRKQHINSESTMIETIEKSQPMINTKSAIDNDSSTESTKIESKSETLTSSPSIEHTKLISPEDVELSTVNTQHDTQNNDKRKFVVLDEKPDVIDISDDDNDCDLIHTLQLSKKLKRNKISLSKQKR